MRGRGAGTDEIVPALRVDGPEGGQRIGLEGVGIPVALDGIDGVAGTPAVYSEATSL